ncbi:capsule assembly Wzi family protein, partial [candidate division KSB1 bacterium]|nr:capsule assembly Wzi family protein [candidate division KSB1 bacterium]
FTYLAAELNPDPAQLINGVRIPVRRFLSGHRLDLKLWHGRFQAALSELMLYGGPGESFNIIYLNPFIFYHGEHKNQASYTGNVLPTIDLAVYPWPRFQTYFSILIDDIQVEKTVVDDLEPNEIAWLLGTKIADPFQIAGLTLNLEYVRIANRTYKTSLPLETFVHFNQSLGHPLGNDGDQWLVSANYWWRKYLIFNASFSRQRNGEGSIYTPWDEPWENFTVAEGYHEPFPTGIAAVSNRMRFKISWLKYPWLRFHGQLQYQTIKNHENVRGQNKKSLAAKLLVEMNWGQKVTLKDNE